MSAFPARTRRSTLLYAGVLAIFCLAGFFWLKMEHVPQAAIDVAKAFVSLLNSEQFSQAYELTSKDASIGLSFGEFETIVHRQACKGDRVIGSSPFQSNGNRLRRWLSGVATEPPEARVEFEGACLLAVTVTHTRGDRWLVSRIASHAG